MLTKKNLWKFRIYSERMWQLSLDIATQGAKLQTHTYGQGIVIVAEETRKLADKLYQHYENILDSGDFSDIDGQIQKTIQQVRFLSINGVLEMLKLYTHLEENIAQLPILFEALNNVSNDLIELVSSVKTTESIRLEVKDRNTTTNQAVYLMTLKVGSQIFMENIQYVHEVFCYNEETNHELFTDDKHVIIRGAKVEVINCYDKFNLSNEVELPNKLKVAVIVETGWAEEPKRYALLVDDIVRWAVFKSPLGKDVPCHQEIFSPYTRACWDSENHHQFMFMDWASLNS